jgi:hypothetical protein
MSASELEKGTTQSQERLVRLQKLWKRSRKDQLEIGKLLYEERAERRRKGGRGIEEGFHQWLQQAGIPKTSAYRRIAEYEVEIGERTEEETYNKPTGATQDKDEKPVPTGTSFEPTDPKSNCDRRQNRAPIKSFAEVRKVALAALRHGFREIKATTRPDVYASAKQWATALLEAANEE